MKTDVIVDPKHLFLRQGRGRASLVVEIVGIRDNGVEAVVAARHLNHDEDAILAGFRRLSRSGQKLRYDRANGEQRRALQSTSQELATREHGSLSNGWSQDREGAGLVLI